MTARRLRQHGRAATSLRRKKAGVLRRARAARAASLRRKKAQVVVRATATTSVRRHARPHCHEWRALARRVALVDSERAALACGPPLRARARADHRRLRRVLGSSSARVPVASSDGWRACARFKAQRGQLRKRTSCARRASAAGGSGAAAWRHTFGVDGRSLSTPLCTSCSPSGRLRPGKGRCGSARANGRGARGCGRCGVPFCNFPAAQIGLARSGSPPWGLALARSRIA